MSSKGMTLGTQPRAVFHRTHGELPGAESALEDPEVVYEQAAAEGVLQVQADQPATHPAPHLEQVGREGG